MHVVIFEGSYWRRFAPLALSRPVFSLVTGASTLLEKQIRYLRPERLTLWVRPEMEGHCRQRIVPSLKIPTTINTPLDEEPALLVSGRTLFLRKYEPPGQEAAVVEFGDSIRKAYVKRPGLSPRDMMERTEKWLSLLELPRDESQARCVESPWDLINWNEESLIEESTQRKGRPKAKMAGSVHFVNEEEVWLGDEVKLSPGCVIDASNGPVLMGDHVSVGANSVVQGPCYIGAYTGLKPTTLVRPGCSIGTMCRIGGEISNSILLGWSNKSHEGFMGDSYIGKWVNLGAGTTTSNMKNTHGEIRMKMGEQEIPTGRRFLGSIMGDHVKTAIGTKLQAGTYVGFCSLLAGTRSVPKFVPSFTFWTDEKVEPYRLEKAIEVLKGVFARKDRAWTEMDDELMRYVQRVAPEVER